MRTKMMVLALASLLLGGLAAAQTATRPEEPSAEATARKALQTLSALVTRENYKSMGFDSLQDAKSATLGIPLQQYMIRLDELKQYGPGTDLVQLLHSTETFTYPVLVQDRTRSSLTVRKQGGRWESESFGGGTYARLLTETRDRLAAENAGAELLEVRVPALNVAFVGVRKGGDLLLAPIQDDPRFKLERGKALPARDVLQALQPAAREHNGLPT